MAKRTPVSLSDADVDLLNTRIGLKHLLADDRVDLQRALKMTRYELRLREMQEQLVHLQNWVITNNERIVVIFEGRDAAGKGGAIRRITGHINPRYYRIIALPRPSEEERGQWYFQRYVNVLPRPGEMVFFDRSWYNRAIVEPVNGFCSTEDYQRFMNQVNDFERMITESGIHLIKLYFSISKDEQRRRFVHLEKSPLKHWKMTSVDRQAQKLWSQYTRYKNKMFKQTDTDRAPWTVIDANDECHARLEALRHILGRFAPHVAQ